MARILYVEDDIKLSALIRDYLSLHGFEVYCLHRGDQVLPWLARQQADLLLLDLMLPGLDGLEVCRQLRAQQTLPILMLTARGNDIDHVLGLELGADDYIIKPVEPRVLVARIKAVLRRQAGAGSEVLRLGQLNLDRVARRATLGQLELELTSSEFELLYLLTSKAGTVLSRDDIINHLRGIDFDGHDRSADVLVSRLRRKLGDDPREPRCIKTVWNRGYLLLPPEEQR
ncbi:response regulator transcription factor [Chitinimonas viridis]|uniref:Response regulator transcription factor n=1 Tax=Chitinimonas viridis TaxID=664880 RepID=A0ABT8B410_9NEIS|nr:response regulator transcription factor [Chitinimonas viridis]MDN3576224.1 response regulator transcription factor [Chitinimonas viridis]